LKELVARMLDVEPRRRISLHHLLQHRWITLRHQLPQLPQMRLAMHDAHLVKVTSRHLDDAHLVKVTMHTFTTRLTAVVIMCLVV